MELVMNVVPITMTSIHNVRQPPARLWNNGKTYDAKPQPVCEPDVRCCPSEEALTCPAMVEGERSLELIRVSWIHTMQLKTKINDTTAKPT